MSENNTVSSAIRLLSKTEGRDKLCRFFQYATKFLVEYKREKALYVPVKEDLLRSASRLENLGYAMTLTRKILRFGRQLQLIHNIKETIDEILQQKTQNVPKAIAKILSQLCLSLFFLFDHVVFFARIGWIKDTNIVIKSEYISNLFWLLECIFSLIKCLFDSIDINQMGVSSGEKKRLKFNLNLEVARNVLDLPIAYSFMHPGSVPTKLVGVLGTITSLIGIYQKLD